MHNLLTMHGKLLTRLLFVLISTLLLCSAISCAGKHHRTGSNSRTNTTKVKPRSGDVIVPLTQEDGVMYLTIRVNDVPMKFIFDTGASLISMSTVEAEFLVKQGTLTEDDIVGTAYFSDANGDTNEGLIVNLRSVNIGGIVVENVKASVVPNQEAPLLLGQTLLQQFGTITIDNKNKQLIIH